MSKGPETLKMEAISGEAVKADLEAERARIEAAINRKLLTIGTAVIAALIGGAFVFASLVKDVEELKNAPPPVKVEKKVEKPRRWWQFNR